MLVPLHSQDSLVLAEIDLHHHVPVRHLLQLLPRMVLVHHVHPMPNPLRMAQLHRLANVKP